MQPAFSDFQEPHAWLIRGLVEYGWTDITRLGGRPPPGVFGGFSLSQFSSTGGRAGIILCVPAVATNQQWLQDDGIYELAVCLTRDEHGALTFAVRCPELNYLQLFAFDASQPIHCAGFIHQALTAYIPEFVTWRFGGGEVPWAQRAGLPEIAGEPCSVKLAQFVSAQISSGRPLHQGQQEGWWLADDASKPAASPLVIATLGQAAENELRAGGVNAASRAMVERSVKGPGGTMLFLASMGIFQGVGWLANIAITMGLFAAGMLHRPAPDYLFSLAFSLVSGLGLLLCGAMALTGARQYMQLKNGKLVWFSMLYTALVPGCCILGLPTTLWALYIWTRPGTVAERTS